MNKKFFGNQRKQHIDWLSNDWRQDGPGICFLEGFPGVGKSELVAEVVKIVEDTHGWVAVTYEIPDRPSISLEDVWLDIADQLASRNLPKMQEVMAGDEPNIAFAIEKALNRNVLIILDEVQRLFVPGLGRPSEALGGILTFLKSRRLPGRLLLLSDRIVERERWSETFSIITLDALTFPDAEAMLEDRLRMNAVDDVPEARKADLLRILGCNPRAIETLVSSLFFEPLDDIIGSDPGLWAVEDRVVSPDFLEKLQRQLLERTLNHLSPLHLQRLTMLAVHRGRFGRAAFEAVCASNRAEWRDLLITLVTRFLVQHKGPDYTLHPIVREISLSRLKANPDELIQAHSKAADYDMRHFNSRLTVIRGDRLRTTFAELRYHLFQARRAAELKDVTLKVADLISNEYSATSKVPGDPTERDERINLLATVVESGGPHWLEHYLARLLADRARVEDIDQAVFHAEKILTERSPGPYWLLAVGLREQLNQIEKAIDLITQGLQHVDKNAGKHALYLRGADLFVRNQEPKEAIKLLRTGLLDIPVDKGLSGVYLATAHLVDEYEGRDAAMLILQEGLTGR